MTRSSKKFAKRDATLECGRRWAFAQASQHRTPDPFPCGHSPGWEAETCVHCAYEMGRRVGHAEAGAYATMDEVMQRVRSKLAFPPTGSAQLGGSDV